MSEPANVPLLWPERTGSPVWFFVIVLVLLFIALAVSIFRRLNQKRQRLSNRWQRAAALAGRKHIGGAEFDAFQELVTRWCPEEPLRFATDREFFEEVLDLEVDEQAYEPLVKLAQMGSVLDSLRRQLGFAEVPRGEALRRSRELHAGQAVTMQFNSGQPISVSVRDTNAYFFTVEIAGAKPLMQRGEDAVFRVSRENDARYIFEAPLLGDDERTGCMAFLHTTNVRRLQDRGSDRVSFGVSEFVEIIGPMDDETVELRELLHRQAWGEFEAEFFDVSATGIAMKAHVSLPEFTLLRFPLAVDSGPPLQLVARVTGCSPVEQGQHFIRAQYVQVGPLTQSKLARYVRYRQDNAIPPPELL